MAAPTPGNGFLVFWPPGGVVPDHHWSIEDTVHAWATHVASGRRRGVAGRPSMMTMDDVPSASTAAATGGSASWPATSTPSAFGHASSHLHAHHHHHHHLLSAGNPFGTSLSGGIAARMNNEGGASSSAAASAAAFAPFSPVAYEEHQRNLLLQRQHQHQRGRDEPMMMMMVPVSSVTGGAHAPSLAYPTMAPSAHINAMYASTLTPRVLLAAGEAPVYVNARQYHAILRRRRARAREEARNRTSDKRKVYPSRSAHAKRRLRGANGAFLTREEVLAGAAGPEAQARARAQEAQKAAKAAAKVAKAEAAAKAREDAAAAAAAAAAEDPEEPAASRPTVD